MPHKDPKANLCYSRPLLQSKERRGLDSCGSPKVQKSNNLVCLFCKKKFCLSSQQQSSSLLESEERLWLDSAGSPCGRIDEPRSSVPAQTRRHLATVSERRSGNVNTRHNQRSAPGSLLFRRSTVSVGWPECPPAFESLVKLTRALVRLLHNLSDGGGRRLRPTTLEGVRVDKASVIVTDLGKGW